MPHKNVKNVKEKFSTVYLLYGGIGKADELIPYTVAKTGPINVTKIVLKESHNG